MLSTEYGTASNIKSRVNRLSVLSAITSTQQRLKLYSRVPPNGLIVYCGTILTVGWSAPRVRVITYILTRAILQDEGKEKKVNFDFEPFKPINTVSLLCSRRSHS
jgi:peptide chain release factor subunit 1